MEFFVYVKIGSFISTIEIDSLMNQKFQSYLIIHCLYAIDTVCISVNKIDAIVIFT